MFKRLHFMLIIFLISIFHLSAEPFSFIYEKSLFSNTTNGGYGDPIYCVNDDGSYVTANYGGASSDLARIYRNGELFWNRHILTQDEFDPTSPRKVLDVKNVLFDGYSNHFAGYYRNLSLFKGNAFLYFQSPNGDIQNFAYDTTMKKNEPNYNIVSFYNQSAHKYIFIATSSELFTSDSVKYFNKYYMMRYIEGAKYQNSIVYDTLSYNIRPLGINIYFEYNTIINLTFYNNVYAGDPTTKPRITYFDRDLNFVKSITIPFTELPEDFKIETITYIPDTDSLNLRFFVTTQIPDMRMMFLEINTQTKTVKSKVFKYFKGFNFCKAIYDKNRNIILAGMCERSSDVKNGPQAFAVFKFDTLFNLKDSLIWERGNNSIMRGFDKYKDDEFIITGYYLDNDNYYYGYTARLNSAPSGVEEENESGISIKQYDNQLSIVSQFSGLDIQIYDVLGRVYLNKRTDAKSSFIELENIPSGVFIVSVQSGTSKKIFKIIK